MPHSGATSDGVTTYSDVELFESILYHWSCQPFSRGERFVASPRRYLLEWYGGPRLKLTSEQNSHFGTAILIDDIQSYNRVQLRLTRLECLEIVTVDEAGDVCYHRLHAPRGSDSLQKIIAAIFNVQRR